MCEKKPHLQYKAICHYSHIMQRWEPQNVGCLTDPVKNRNSVIMIIIIANNTGIIDNFDYVQLS